MASLEDKIPDLEKKIARYEEKLAQTEGDTAREDKLLDVIASSRKTLVQLLDQRREQARGKALFLEFYCDPFTVVDAEAGPAGNEILLSP